MVLLPLSVFAPPRAILRPSSRRVDPSFAALPHALSPEGRELKGSLALYVDGRDTGVRVPRDARVQSRSNQRGDLAGSVQIGFSGAYSGITVRPFVKPKGGRFAFVPLPNPKAFSDLQLQGMDEQGRVLLLATQGFMGTSLDDPFYGISHAYLWDKGRLSDLGPAETVKWSRAGRVEGTFYANTEGHPVNSFAGKPTSRTKRRFVWQDGRRTEAALD